MRNIIIPMGNNESLTADSHINERVLNSAKLERDISQNNRIIVVNNNRKMSMGLLRKLSTFSHLSDGDCGKNNSLDTCSMSSDEIMSEDSPVTPPGPDLSLLSDSERQHIAQVIARAKDIERDEDERLREIENELSCIEEVANSKSSNYSLSSEDNFCSICVKSSTKGESHEMIICVDCNRRVCEECGGYNSDPGSTFADFLCSICQKKRYLVLSSGMWFHGLCHNPFPKTLSIHDLLKSPKKSLSQSEELLDTSSENQDNKNNFEYSELSYNKFKSLSFHDNSISETKADTSAKDNYNLEMEKNSDKSQCQIQPEYQEIKNRYLQDFHLGRTKPRRPSFPSGSVFEFINQQDSDFPDILNKKLSNLVSSINVSEDKVDHNNKHEKSGDEPNFPLVDDVINFDLSSEDEDENTNDDKHLFLQSSIDKVDKNASYLLQNEVLDSSSSSNHSISKSYETIWNAFEGLPSVDSESISTSNFIDIDNTYHENVKKDFLSKSQNQYDKDINISQFTHTNDGTTSQLKCQTSDYNKIIPNAYQSKFTFQDTNTQNLDNTITISYQFPSLISTFLNTNKRNFERSVLSPIPDLSPNSCKAEETKNKVDDIIFVQPLQRLINCNHESDEDCGWCYRDSSSDNSKHTNSFYSISSPSLSSTSSHSSFSFFCESIENKSISQLKRCQNYTNIRGLSIIEKPDHPPDNIVLFERKDKRANFNPEYKKTLTTTEQFSKDMNVTILKTIETDEGDKLQSRNHVHEFSVTTTPSCNKSFAYTMPLSTARMGKYPQDEKYNVNSNVKSFVIISPSTSTTTTTSTTSQLTEQPQYLSKTNLTCKYVSNNKNSTFYNKISDTRARKFSSVSTTVSEIMNRQLNGATTSMATISNSAPNTKVLEKFALFAGYISTAKNYLLNKLYRQLQVPIEIQNRKSLVNEEILLITQINRQHSKEFVQIQNVELQLNLLRTIEKHQMTEIQEKMAEIQSTKSVMSYPRLSKSHYYSNYVPNNDYNNYYYLPQRNSYRYNYPQYHYQNPYSYRQDQMFKYEPYVDDKRSSYSIHSSPQCLGYGGSYARELKYNPYYYVDPGHNPHRGFSLSTDQISMHYSYPNYPMEMSHSDQGLFNMAYNYPTKINDRLAFNIDIELMQKEQRVIELEREIELRKRQIEETIRYQEELLQLAELNNVNVNEYKTSYNNTGNQHMVECDIGDDYINEKSQRQYPEEIASLYYPFEDMPMSHQQFASYYDNLYEQNDPKTNICYTDSTIQHDPFYSQQYPSNMDSSNLFGQQLESDKTFSQHQARYMSKPYLTDKRSAYNITNQSHIDYGNQMEKEIDKISGNVFEDNNIKANYKQIRPLSGEYENVAPLDSNMLDSEIRSEKPNPRSKINARQEIVKPVKINNFPTKRLLLMRDSKEKNLRGNGVGMRIIGGQLCSDGHLGAFIEQIFPGSMADRLQDQIKEGDEIIEWNGLSLVGKTFEEVRSILNNDSDEIEFLVRVDTVDKFSEKSKIDSEEAEENHVKVLSGAYENMSIKDNINHSIATTKKENYGQMEGHHTSTSSNETPIYRRTQSIKRQKSQECDTNASTQNQQKPFNKASLINESHHTGSEYGSPDTTRRELSIVSPSHPRKSASDINEISCEKIKNEGDNEKNSSQGDKILGEIQAIISFDDFDQSLTVNIAKARNMLPMDLNGLADPFVKIRLHPDPTEDPDFNRQTKYMSNTLNPEWQQTVVFLNVLKRSLKKRVLDLSVWDFDRLKSNDFMGQTLISLANKNILDGKPHWYKLTDMKDVEIPGLRQPANRKLEGKNSIKGKPTNKPSKEIKSSKDEVTTISNTPPYNRNNSSNFSPTLPNQNLNVSHIQLQNSEIINTIHSQNSANNNPICVKTARNTSSFQMSPDNINSFVRTDTTDSKSSNSSSVTTDFLSEEQREIVRKWLGPGQLLMLSYTQRVDKVGNLPDDSLVIAELYISLRKIAGDDLLIVSLNSLKTYKLKNILEVYIKLYLMYSEHQLSRVMKRKTKPIMLIEESSFNETFNFKTQLEGMLLQVSLWSCGKGLNVHKMLGEAVIHLDDIEFVSRNSMKDVSGWYKLLKPDI